MSLLRDYFDYSESGDYYLDSSQGDYLYYGSGDYNGFPGPGDYNDFSSSGKRSENGWYLTWLEETLLSCSDWPCLGPA